jgi:hypothetical protein
MRPRMIRKYEIKSDKTDHVAMHRGSALKKANA